MNTATSSPLRREPQLAGQTVVVIGGSAGIGLETARLAHAEGARLILAARNLERLREAASELPVELPLKYDLIVNMKTAKALGLTIPPSVLGRADQVIE